jgi:hypothetical protein
MIMERYDSLSKALLFDSQLKYRLGLVLKRLESYPLDTMNFVMMDLERPPLRTRHAHFCSYDLTGRTLNLYACVSDITGMQIERLTELYQRIMQLRRPSGMFGNACEDYDPDKQICVDNQFLCGLVNYYTLTGDMRALTAAEAAAEHALSAGDKFFLQYPDTGAHHMGAWICEGFAELYRETRDVRYLNVVRRIARECLGSVIGAHAHGYLTTLRGLQRAAVYSGDSELAEIVKTRRQEILDNGYVHPNGDIPECFPSSGRNEGCACADWIMLNLYHGYIYDDASAYEEAEHSLWNALYFNQFVTGGFGHRYFACRGYRTYIEEAWWCCTQTGGLCITEVARHTVTVKNGQLKLNFIFPGRYTVPSEHGNITVTVTTGYPVKAKTHIAVEGTKEDISIRIPKFIKDFSCVRTETDFGYRLDINGIMGHYVEKRGDGYTIKYGPLMLAPMIYSWNMVTEIPVENTVPDGYTHDSVPNYKYSLVLGKPDKNGFLEFNHDPLPCWSVFEEGELAGISGGEVAAVHIPVRFADGSTRDMYFQPLCSATSNLTLMDIPTVFDISEE